MADMRTNAEEALEYWKTNATEEQKSVGLDELEKFQTDEAFQTEQMTSFVAEFESAGPNEAGCLDEAKCIIFLNKLSEMSAARGNFED